MATVKDVARLADVSPSTVSAVLTGRVAVKESTKRRVQAAIETLGYTRNYAARSLRTKSSKLIGLVVSDISNRHFAKLARVVSAAGRERGYVTMIANTEGDPAQERDAVQNMLEQQIDGLILEASSSSEIQKDWLESKIGQLPCVMVENIIEGTCYPSVQMNNYDLGKQAVQHLFDKGHRKIGILSGSTPFSSALARKQGCVDQLTHLELSDCKKWVVDAEFDKNTAVERTLGLLAGGFGPTALISLNNQMTIGALEAIQRLGYSIPGDVSILGFDRFDLADYLNPRLSLFEYDTIIEEMGLYAVNKVLDSIEGKGKLDQSVSKQFEGTFVERDSVVQITGS